MNTSKRRQDLSGGAVLLVMPSKITGVVEGHAKRSFLGLERYLSDQILKDLAVMKHLKIAAKFRVFVFYGMIGVWREGDDFFDVQALKFSQIFPSHPFKESAFA